MSGQGHDNLAPEADSLQKRLCGIDAWTEIMGDPAPRAVRWAKRELRGEVEWTRWHYTEGNGLFTACGMPVQLFTADGSPAEAALTKVDCRRCQACMKGHDHGRP